VRSSLPSPLPFMREPRFGCGEHGCWGPVAQCLHTQLSGHDDCHRPGQYLIAEPIHHRPHLDKHGLRATIGDIRVQQPIDLRSHDPTQKIGVDRAVRRMLARPWLGIAGLRPIRRGAASSWLLPISCRRGLNLSSSPIVESLIVDTPALRNRAYYPTGFQKDKEGLRDALGDR